MAFRTLAEPGGPGFTIAQATAIAAEYQVPAEPDDQGEVKPRPARLADYFPPPFPNEQAARARYNAVPPDLSVIAKARGYERGFPRWVGDMFTQYQEQGVDYITALLQGYQDSPPAGVTLPPGNFYNKYFPGHGIAMPPPLTDQRVEYTDGAPMTVEQYAKDISAFLMWTAEPHLEAQEADRHAGRVLSDRAVRASLLHQEEGLARRQAASGEAHAAPADRISAHVAYISIEHAWASRRDQRPSRVLITCGSADRMFGSTLTFSNSQRAKRDFSVKGMVASMPSFARIPF